jgi:hypothetical protein
VEIVRDSIVLDRLRAMADARFGEMVKAVVLTRKPSCWTMDRSRHIWGINLYPAEYDNPTWLEFDSMINLRPGQGNRTRSVEDPAVRDRIAQIVAKLVVP